MKDRIVRVIVFASITALVDLGLLSVFLDLAFRGDDPNIQVVAFLMIFLTPILMLGLFLTGSAKAAAWLGILLICAVFFHLIEQYGVRLLTELDLAIFTIGFLTTILLCIALLRKGLHGSPSK
jgi:hypothetical protein